MRLDDHHSPPLGLDLLAHQVAPAEGLQLDHPLPQRLVLLCQQVAPGNCLQTLKPRRICGGKKGVHLQRGLGQPGHRAEKDPRGTESERQVFPRKLALEFTCFWLKC